MKSSLDGVYRRLYDFWGPQGWWPAEDAFEVIVGAVLTQNTAWTNVEKAIGCLKREGLLASSAIGKAPFHRLARAIRSSGYYRVKARRLRTVVRFFRNRCGNNLGRFVVGKDLATLRGELLNVEGIGPETADSILLYAFQQPVFVVDAYTKRIFSRHGLFPSNAKYDEVQSLFMRSLPPDVKLYNEFHALIVRLGKKHCRPRRRCCGCPLAGVVLSCKPKRRRL